MQNRIIIPITPETNVRSTQGSAILFRIPEECPVSCGLPRITKKTEAINIHNVEELHPDLWEVLGGEAWAAKTKRKVIRYGCPHMISKEGLLIKRRLERYNEYKATLKGLTRKIGFELPVAGWSLYFYIPIPTRWTGGKRKLMHGQFKMSMPDDDNYYKAFKDALSITDETVAQLSGMGKFWVDTLKMKDGKKTFGNGWIEILMNQPIYNPFNVTFIDQQGLGISKVRSIKKEDMKRIKEFVAGAKVDQQKLFSKKDNIK